MIVIGSRDHYSLPIFDSQVSSTSAVGMLGVRLIYQIRNRFDGSKFVKNGRILCDRRILDHIRSFKILGIICYVRKTYLDENM